MDVDRIVDVVDVEKVVVEIMPVVDVLSVAGRVC